MKYKKLFFQEIIRHEDYTDELKKNDIALIRLNKDISFSPSIRPACLEMDLHDLGPNVRLTLTGWGSSTGSK